MGLCRSLAWLLLVLVIGEPRALAQTPDSDLTVYAIRPTGGALHFSWMISPNWTSVNFAEDIDGFQLFLDGNQVETVDAATRNYAFYGLHYDTTYTFQVLASLASTSSGSNGSDISAGSSLASDLLSATTTIMSQPEEISAPQILQVTGGSAQVSVQLPMDTGGTAMESMTVFVRKENTVVKQVTQPSDALSFSFYGLNASTSYRISVSGKNRGGLSSPESTNLEVTTNPLQLPDPCPAPTILNTTGASVALQLNPPLDDGGGRIVGYNVYMTASYGENFTKVASTLATDFVDVVEILSSSESENTPLLPNTEYSFKSIAVNLADICISESATLLLATSMTVTTTAASAPGAPPSPYFLSATGGLISMSLIKTPNMRGAVLQGFSIRVNGSYYLEFANITADGNDVFTSYNSSSLRAQSEYEVTISVITNLGMSPWSSASLMNTTDPSNPTSPRAIIVTNSTASSAALQWSSPYDTGGVNMTGYTILLTSRGSQETKWASSSPTLLTNLIADTVYSVIIVAINAAGKMSPTDVTTGVSFKTRILIPPTEPWAISSAFTSGGAIEVTWNPPVERGGEDLLGLIYYISMFLPAGCVDSSSSNPCASCNSVKALQGDCYNIVQNQVMCERSTSCPDGSLECCITTHESMFGPGLQCMRMLSETKPKSVFGTTSTLLSGLNYSSTYYFGVQAVNRAGKSAVSVLVGLSTSDQSLPSFSTNIHSVTTTGGLVQLSWTAPLDTGGTPILGYRVYRDYELLTSQFIQPPYNDCGKLTADTTYMYGITALNGSLAEGAISTANLVTKSISAPAAPVVVFVGRGYNWLQVTVETTCDTGGDESINYQYVVENLDGVVASNYFGCCSFMVVDLMSNFTYNVSVKVDNAVQESQWTTITIITTAGVPAVPAVSWIANTFTSVVKFVSEPNDVLAYMISLYHNNNLIQTYLMPCNYAPGYKQNICPDSCLLTSLEANTTYQVDILAHGPIGNSDSTTVQFLTSGISKGMFEMSSTEYVADVNGNVNVTVTRTNGTSGVATVGINVSTPETVLANCELLDGGSCYCTLYLATSGIQSKPCNATFIDGQDKADVTFSLWNNLSAEILPSNIVVTLLGEFLTEQNQALLLADAQQDLGFVSFSSGFTRTLENSSFVLINVVRLNGSSGNLSFAYKTFDMSAIANKHYIPANGTAVLFDQQRSQKIWIKILDNRVYDIDRSFGITLQNQLMTSTLDILITHRVTILDDERLANVVPRMPEGLSISQISGGEFSIMWNDTIASGYIVRVTAATTNMFSSLFNTTTSYFTISGLDPSSIYSVDIAAWNSFGLGQYSQPMEVITTDITPPTSPRSFNFTNVTRSTVTLLWQSPRDDGGSPVVGYHVRVLTTDGNFVRVIFVDAPEVSVTVDNLIPLTGYVFSVTCDTIQFSDNQNTGSSVQISVTTAVGAIPKPPASVTLLDRPHGGALRFAITRPIDTGGFPLLRMTLYLRVTSQTSSSVPFAVACDNNLFTVANSTDTCVVINLLAATSYDVYATYLNVMGESLPSDQSTFNTDDTIALPSPPVNLRATLVTAGSIKLEWDLPNDLGGASDVVGYIVYQKYDASSDGYFTCYDGEDSTVRSVVVKSLIRNTVYAFAVVALNSASFCSDSSLYNVSPFMPVSTLALSSLSPPEQVALHARTGGSITIGWTEPQDLAGVNLQGYVVELLNSNNSYTVLTNSLSNVTTTYTHYGLLANTNYVYVVTARNQDGPSGRSNPATIMTSNVSVPTQVENIKVVQAYGGSITLSWDLPLDTGGSSIQNYEVTRYGRSKSWIEISNTFNDYHGLTANTNYTYQIRAFNGLYNGDSQFVPVTTGLPSLSHSPLLSITPFGGRLEVTWGPPEDTGGIPISRYTITLYNADETVAIATITTTLTFTVFGNLQASTKYYLTGIAINDMGPSDIEGISIETSMADAPGTPPKPVADAIQGGSVHITVQQPAYTGGEDVTMTLYRDYELVYSFPVGKWDVTIYGLVANSTYFFSVSAQNSQAGTRSEAHVVTTTSITTPGQVQKVRVGAVSFDQMTLTWDDVEDTGGDEYLQYVVTYFKCSSSGVQDMSNALAEQYTDTNSILIDSLLYSSFYNVSVAAKTTTNLTGMPSPSIVVVTQTPFRGVIEALKEEVTVPENAGVVYIPVDRVNGSFGSVSYAFETIGGSAQAGVNFMPTNGTQTILTNIQSGNFTIPILNDDVYNPGISFNVTITDVNTNIKTVTRVVLTDDGDAGYISFTAPQQSVLENRGVIPLDLVRTGGSSPKAVIQPLVLQNASSIDRFNILNHSITFDEGITTQTLLIAINDDTVYQYIPDKINISFNIVEGGVLYGMYPSVVITAADDGDISLPKQCSPVQNTSITGGSVGLQWTPPLDRGGNGISLQYLLSFVVKGVVVLSVNAASESQIVYGLNQSTTYSISVQAINSAGAGSASTAVIISTPRATPPSAPRNIQILSASSSSALISWDVPLDNGGSPIVTYTIFNVSQTGTRALFPSTTCDPSVQTLCTVKPLNALTTYRIQIQGSTSFVPQGVFSDITAFNTSNPDFPQVPPTPNMIWSSAGAMTIQMYDPDNVGGSSIQWYWLFMRADDDPDFAMIYNGTVQQFTVYRLQYQTVYHFKYRVVNSVGPSGYSPEGWNQTLERSLPSEPTNVQVENVTGGAITLNWSEPLDIGGRTVTGYAIRIVAINGSSTSGVGYDGHGISIRKGTVYSLNSYSLNASTIYGMQVVAYLDISNCFDSSLQSWSPLVNVSTSNATYPRTAPDLVVGYRTGGVILLSWIAPMDKGGIPLNGYTVYSIKSSGLFSIAFSTKNASVLAFAQNNLTASTSYSFSIVTSNDVGSSPISAIVNTSTDVVTPPSAPLRVRQLTNNTGGSISLGWDPPFDSGGQALAGYKVYRNGDLVSGLLSNSTSTFLDKNQLVASSSYDYSVRAVGQNALISVASDDCPANTTVATNPKNPVFICVTAVGSSYLNISWVLDMDTGGLPIINQEVRLMVGSVMFTDLNVTESNYLFTGLDGSTNYTGSVKVYNSVGPSGVVFINMTTTNATVPEAPIKPVPISISGGNFTVQVSSPLFTGGAKVTAIKVYESTLNQVFTLLLTTGNVATKTFYGVTAESDYSVTCSAINTLGEGPQSDPVRIRTSAVNAPGPILTPPVVISTTGQSISISWASPLDTGGNFNLTYEVQVVGPSGIPSVNPATFPPPYTATQLAFDTPYYIYVRAKLSVVFVGGWSPARLWTTQPDAAGVFSFLSSELAVLENATQLAIPVQRASGVTGAITLSYSLTPTSGSSALFNSYYQSVIGTVEFKSQQTLSYALIRIINDAVYEPAGSFFVRLTAATSTGIIGTNNTVKVTVLDDGDAGYISFEKPSYSFMENARTVSVSIIREYGKSTSITLKFDFIDGTAAIDVNYRKITDSIIMGDGVTQANLAFAIINDRVYEFPEEYFDIRMTIASGGAILAQPQTRITILDDGDVSNPATCSPLQLASRTGGLAMFLAGLPLHNGSASGLLSNYLVNLTYVSGSMLIKKDVTTMISIGNLTANTAYNVSIAANSTFGLLGNFSNVTMFLTTGPTLPGATTTVNLESRTGGRLSLIWVQPDDTGGIPVIKYKVFLVDTLGHQTVANQNTQPTTRATIYGLSASTKYSFSIQAGNALQVNDTDGWGVTSGSFTFSTSIPTQPGAVNLNSDYYQKPTGGKISLSWEAPLDTGGTNITSYAVYCRSSILQSWFLATRVAGDAGLHASVNPLNASTAYEFFVLAESLVSAVALPGKFSVAGDSRVMRTTTDLSSFVSIGSVISVENYTFVISAVTPGSISLLYPHSSSSIVAQDGENIGVATTLRVLNTTTPSLPDVPSTPTLTFATGGMINVTLLSPPDTGGIPIEGYSIYLNGEELNEDDFVMLTSKSNFLQLQAVASVSQLKPLTNYSISAVAINSFSLCYFGRTISGPNDTFQTTAMTSPDSPDLETYRTTGGGITMTLIDPHDTGGNGIQVYKLYYKQDGTPDQWKLGYSGPSHQATVARLTPLTAYMFMASVNNGFYTSENSTVKNVSTTDKSPPGPCDPAIFANATGGMLTVSWDYPPDNGGSEITEFFVTIASSEDGSERKTINTSSLSYPFFRLIADSSYDIVIRAKNDLGIGPESTAATFKTTALTPPSGDVTITVSTTTGGAADINFEEPDDLGGVTSSDMVYNIYLDRYNILNVSYDTLVETTAQQGSRRLSEAFATVFSNVVFGNMDPVTLYALQISPVNTDFGGNLSSSVGVKTTTSTTPTTPQGLTLESVTGGSASLSWNPPIDSGGSPITGYSLSMSATSKNGPFAEAYNDMMTKATITGLQATSSYWVYVTTWNDIGLSPQSEILSFSTHCISPPSPPRNLSLVSVSSDTIECSWEAPSDTGGDTIKSYTVDVSETQNPQVVTSMVTNLLATKVTTLSLLTAYSITVSVSTFTEFSPASLPKYATTSAGVNIPSAPQVGCVSQTSVDLFWYPYPGAVAYRVLRDGNIVIDGVANTFATDNVDFGVSNLNPFTYTLQVNLGSGFGPSSASTILSVVSYPPDVAVCAGNSGRLRQLNYGNNVKKQWDIDPPSPYSTITVTFLLFKLECDHDFVEIIDKPSGNSLWKGGCVRTGRFVYQAARSITVKFTSDASVSNEGFEAVYEVDGSSDDTRIPPPEYNTICSSHGRSLDDGTCKCNVGFIGEGCNSRAICCSDPQQCHHMVCDTDPKEVIAVSQEFGNDSEGTGELMDPSETGTASKSVQTLSRAITLSTPGSVILVDPGMYSSTLNQDLNIPSTNLTIVSLKGYFWTTVDCTNSSRFGVSLQSTLSIEGFTFKNCVNEDGGILKISGGTLIMKNVLTTFSRSDKMGGMIFANGSRVTLDQVQLINSSAGLEGGAVYTENSQIIMMRSNVTMCTATRGAGLALRGSSSLQVVGTEIFSNVASESGGGIFSSGEISIDGVVLYTNVASNGGAIASDSGILQVRGCSIQNNTAKQNGGGISLIGNVSLTPSNSSIQNNHAGATGGGIYVTGNISVTSVSIALVENTAAIGAGMSIAQARVYIKGVNFVNCTASKSGGGVAIVDSTVQWSNIVVQGNEAQTGGGVVIGTSQVLSQGTVLLTKNRAVDGGAVSISMSTMSGGLDTKCLFNSADRSGGAVYIDGSVTIENVTQDRNTAVTGGCMYANDASITLVGGTITNCLASKSGGGIMALDSDITISGCSVSQCNSTDGGGLFAMDSAISGALSVLFCDGTNHGGGVFVTGNSSLTGLTVSNCSAVEGGAVYATDSNILIELTDLTSSSASEKGGGLCAINSTVELKGSHVLGDQSKLLGGGVFAYNSTVIHDNLLVNNCNASTGGGLYLQSSKIKAKSYSLPSTLSQNIATSSGGNVFLSGVTVVENAVITFGTAASGGGAGVNSESSTFNNCSISNNTATDGGGLDIQSGSLCTIIASNVSFNTANGNGGGMHVIEGTIKHDRLTVQSNIATLGAGIYAEGQTSILKRNESAPDATFRMNTAVDSNAIRGYGGAIFAASSSRVEADGLILVEGEAYRGAGIHVDGAIFSLNNSTIQHNNASSGGGMFANAVSDLRLRSCTFEGNVASQSGGGLVSSGNLPSDRNKVFLQNCTFRYNSAQVFGGGMMLSFTNVSGVNNTLIQNIVYGGSGGAIALLSEGCIELNGWSVINNTVGDSLVAQGGSIHIRGGTNVTISDSYITSNRKSTRAQNGGLIYVENVETMLTIINTLLEFGQSYSGGLIYSVDATIRLQNASLQYGYAYDFGAGIFAVNTILTVIDSIFYFNFAFYDGGAIFMKDSGTLTVRGSLFNQNLVSDGGGAIFLNPGAGVLCSVFATNFTSNANSGSGSALYIGRTNTATILGCIISQNGIYQSLSTDGGALYVVDATVNVHSSVFENNSASNGAAIQIARSATVVVNQTSIRNNTASSQGGALYASIQASATFVDSFIDENSAGEGGAMYAQGFASIALYGVKFTSNVGEVFGGAVSLRGSASLTSCTSDFNGNMGYTGGAISLQENASIFVTNSTFQENKVKDFGAGIYIDKKTATITQTVKCLASRFGGNDAVAGDDIYWVFYPWFQFNCTHCTTMAGSNQVNISTSAMAITAGWWPSSVTSGVSLGVKIAPNTTGSTTSDIPTNSRMLALSDAVVDSMNASLVKPSSTTLWPTLVTRDYYGAIATYDNVTSCRANATGFSFFPSSSIPVDGGYIVFKDAVVRSSNSRDLPYQVNITCTLSPQIQPSISIDITVDPCNPGYENIHGDCVPCEKDTYSMDGEGCYGCPLGATCQQRDSSGVLIGVIYPVREAGYFSDQYRKSFAESSCHDRSTWSPDDPCLTVAEADVTALIHECSQKSNFSKYWSQNRVYACLSKKEFYECETNDACIASNIAVSTLATNTSVTQCGVGYVGVKCATCDEGFYKVSSGLCRRCSDPKDPAVARTAQMLAMIPMIAGVVALVLIIFVFSNSSEHRVVKHAQAAKRFQVYNGQSRVRMLLLAAKGHIQRRIHTMIQAVVEQARKRSKRKAYLFQIEPKRVQTPGWRPEKFKIMLGFFQVLGSFKAVYEIPWPNAMSRLMDICSIADFNFVDSTAVECIFKRNYFRSYRLAVFALLGVLLLICLLVGWGILRYRVKLATLPRHCVKCGLPVFKLVHRKPRVMARRSTLLIKLKMEQKLRLAAVPDGNASLIVRLRAKLDPGRVLERAKAWKIILVSTRLFNRVSLLPQIAASVSTHEPRCPTSQRISGDVREMVVHSNLRLWRARVWMRLYYKSYQNKCIKLFFWILLLFYPMLSQRVIGSFYCEEIGEHFYMSLDLSEYCYEGIWRYYLPISTTLIVFWVMGVPLLFWVIISLKRSRAVNDILLLIQDPSQAQLKEHLLLKMRLDMSDRGLVMDEEKLRIFETDLLAQYLRNKNLNEPSTVAQVGFIYHSYKSQFWWFEVWDLGRKLLLNCVISLLAKAGANRIICGLVVLLVYLSVMLFYQPYRHHSDSALAGLTHIQLFVTLFCGLILKMGSLYLEGRVVWLVTSAAVFSNVMTLCYAALSILNEKVEGRKLAQRRSREDHRRSIAAHVRKLWRMAYGYALTEVYLSNPESGPMSLLVMKELARRERQQREMDLINAQVELTSAISPLLPVEEQDPILSVSQVDIMDDSDILSTEKTQLHNTLTSAGSTMFLVGERDSIVDDSDIINPDVTPEAQLANTQAEGSDPKLSHVGTVDSTDDQNTDDTTKALVNNAHVELTSAVSPMLTVEDQDPILSLTQLDAVEDNDIQNRGIATEAQQNNVQEDLASAVSSMEEINPSLATAQDDNAADIDMINTQATTEAEVNDHELAEDQDQRTEVRDPNEDQ